MHPSFFFLCAIFRHFRSVPFLLESDALGSYKHQVTATVGQWKSKETFSCHTLIAFKGQYPELSVCDIRSKNKSVQFLWDAFNINELNTLLVSQTGANERDYVTRLLLLFNVVIKAEKDFFLEPLCAQTKQKRLPPITERTNLQQLILTLEFQCKIDCRMIDISTDVQLSFLREIENMNKENWIEKEESSPQSMMETIIMSERLFEVEPSSVHLLPYRHVSIQFRYHHKIYGEHKMPVMLSIKNGKKIILNLQGATTTEDTELKFYVPHSEILLYPQPIGCFNDEDRALLQTVNLENISQFDISYFIDTNIFEQYNKKQYDFPIFKCVNPSGVIPGKSTQTIYVKFFPLEEREYRITVPVIGRLCDKQFSSNNEHFSVNVLHERIEVQQNTQMTLGYHPANHKAIRQNQELKMRKYPTYPLLSNNALIQLSRELLDFGELPLDTSCRRLVGVSNLSNTGLFYKWNIPSSRFIRFNEMKGTIAKDNPGLTLFTITIYSNVPAVIDESVCCECHFENGNWIV
ncbi:coiled-coil domain containing protein [Reticulomyxa filosa]|uniref:Coiled-coil domain containing protein n=1 Tax=Reticulomyxa filosa TaxID=46433 RepID=X6M8P3_RETFI|nr:coiled-coil domain containing protein [Reticulomyxa filosa]|eukprot:ETO10021.1 coiled-coil domain containing protein [Reticulomyxa filosa]